jgi:hypothetical protein
MELYCKRAKGQLTMEEKWNLGYYSKNEGVEVFFRKEGPRARTEFRAVVWNKDRKPEEQLKWQNHCGYPPEGYGSFSYAIRQMANGKYEINWTCAHSCE